jgi:hypothetical protein
VGLGAYTKFRPHMRNEWAHYIECIGLSPLYLLKISLITPLKSGGNENYHPLKQSASLFCVYTFRKVFVVNSIDQLIFIQGKCCVLFWVTDWIPKYYLDERRFRGYKGSCSWYEGINFKLIFAELSNLMLLYIYNVRERELRRFRRMICACIRVLRNCCHCLNEHKE